MPTIAQYNQDLLSELTERSNTAATSLREEAFERLCSTLEAEGELETSERIEWHGTFRGLSLRIDGHSGDPRETDGTLCLIAFEIDERPQPSVMRSDEVIKLFSQLRNFAIASTYPEFLETLPSNTQIRGTTEMLSSAWPTVTALKLILVTNRLFPTKLDAQRIKGDGFKSVPVTYSLWDLQRIHRVETTGTREPIEVNFDRDFDGALPALAASDQDAPLISFIAIIRGDQLAKMYDIWGARLLEANIRAFIRASRKSVNEGIRETISKTPNMFFNYNNGLSVTVDSLELRTTENGIMIHSACNFQIVNGGQTTASLHAALRHAEQNLKAVRVQLKLTVVPPEQSDLIVPNISKYANSQNKLNPADFFSNHPFHLRVESYSRRVNAPPKDGQSLQTKWFYERARGQYMVERSKLKTADLKRFDIEYPKTQLFTKTDLAKLELSFNQKPDVVSKGAQKAFVAFSSEIGSGWTANAAAHDELWYQRLIGKLIIFRTLEANVPKQPWYLGAYRANIVTYGIAKFVQYADQVGKSLDLDRVWLEQSVDKTLLASLLIACEAAAQVIGMPPTGLSNVTEWCKKQACWSSLMGLTPSYAAETEGCLVDPGKTRTHTRLAQREDALLSGINAQKMVAELGPAFWARLRTWATTSSGFSAKDVGILLACSQQGRRFPSERQCITCISILHRARDAGYLDDEETPRIRLSPPRLH